MDPTLVPQAAMATPEHLTTVGLFLKADPIVKGVVALLALASVAVWAIILDKAVRLSRLRREAARFHEQARSGAALVPDGAAGSLTCEILAAGHAEARDRDEALSESRAERRERIERAMRATVGAELRRLEKGLPFLATTGSAAPFVGLFGTVWGIMNSFQAIARSQDTSLAVVAPGIAEALFATAIGLAAAIPAVIAYNKITNDLSQIAYRLSSAIGALGARLARGGLAATAMQKAAE